VVRFPDAYYGNEDSGNMRGHYYHVFACLTPLDVLSQQIKPELLIYRPRLSPIGTVLQVTSSICANINLDHLVGHLVSMTFVLVPWKEIKRVR
jgi:hypothetical protein